MFHYLFLLVDLPLRQRYVLFCLQVELLECAKIALSMLKFAVVVDVVGVSSERCDQVETVRG